MQVESGGSGILKPGKQNAHPMAFSITREEFNALVARLSIVTEQLERVKSECEVTNRNVNFLLRKLNYVSRPAKASAA